MKWIIKRCLLAAPAIIFYSLFSVNVCLITGCGSTDSTGPGTHPRVSGTSLTELRLSAKSSTDSTGPKVIVRTSGVIPAGSTVALDCPTPENCNLRSSTDSTGAHGSAHMLVLGTIPYDIPDNTVLELKVLTNGYPAKTDSVAKVR